MPLATVNGELLVCQFPQAKALEESTNGLTVVRSPVSCMDAAVSKEYGGIVIFFSTPLISERESLIELCAHLNSNTLTRSIRKCLLLEYQHRHLLVKLREVGVKYVDIKNTNEAANPRKIWERLNAEDSALRIESHLSRLCPFLRYRPISEQNELITCGAYRNRMVLGGRRLHEVCQTETHLYCEYYLNPRAVE
jgi:hypothetical protein